MKTNIDKIEILMRYSDVLEKCFHKLIEQNGSNSHYYFINNKLINKIKNIEEFIFMLRRSTKNYDIKAFNTRLTDIFTGFHYTVAGLFNDCFTTRDFINHKPNNHYTKSIPYMILIDSTREDFEIISYSNLKHQFNYENKY